MVSAETFRRHFQSAHPFERYIAQGTADQQAAWRRVFNAVALTSGQAGMVGSWKRRMHVLCISGVWCGDCVAQGPMLTRIAEANPKCIDLRFCDRDAHIDLARSVKICGGMRVPTVIFAAEDDEFVSLLGDRTLSRYRAVAARQLGPSCPLPGAPLDPDEAKATMADWVAEFERVQLVLRLSPRLRERHAD